MRELFEEYAVLTRNVMSGIKLNIPVDEFFLKREEVIKEIVNFDVSNEEKKSIYCEMKLDELDKNLGILIKSEMATTKEDIRKLSRGRKMQRMYSSNIAPGNYFGGRA